jgi:hypothetical protein
VVAVGHPASTQRGLTVAQRQYHRDVLNPLQLGIHQKRIAALNAYMAQGNEQSRRGSTQLRSLENTIKRLSGQQEGLRNTTQLLQLQKEEEALRAEVRKRPELLQKFGDAWFKLQALYAKLGTDLQTECLCNGGTSKLLTMALHLVRHPEELKKPSGERLEEFRESRLPALQRELLSSAPVYADLEEAILTDWFTQISAALGSGDPFVQTLLGGQTPQAVAHKLATESRLTEQEERRALLEGGADKLAASTDPLIVLARKLDSQLRKSARSMNSKSPRWNTLRAPRSRRPASRCMDRESIPMPLIRCDCRQVRSRGT